MSEWFLPWHTSMFLITNSEQNCWKNTSGLLWIKSCLIQRMLTWLIAMDVEIERVQFYSRGFSEWMPVACLFFTWPCEHQTFFGKTLIRSKRNLFWPKRVGNRNHQYDKSNHDNMCFVQKNVCQRFGGFRCVLLL